MLKPLVVILALLAVGQVVASEPKPSIATRDGFPTGGDTPEGAACDLARAFIRDDAALFLATCAEGFGSPEARTAYHRFLEGVVVQMKLDPAKSGSSPESPRSIDKCFAARRLAKAGAASGFQDVMFVDVSARLQNGGVQLCRTLVLRNAQGKWVVDPQPDLAPALSAGLDDEPPSTQDFSEVYAVK